MDSNLLAKILGLFVSIYAILWIRSYRRLCHIPGPRGWGWSIIPLLRQHLAGQYYIKFGEIGLRYGNLARIAPNILLTSDADVIRRMNMRKSPYLRSIWYIAVRMSPGLDNVISVRDEQTHEHLRKRMAAGYSGKENVTLEVDIDDCIRDLVAMIGQRYLSTEKRNIPMELAQKVQFFTSDVMSKLAFNAKFNDLRDDNDNFGYINEINTIFPSMYCTSLFPGTLDLLTRAGLLQLISPKEGGKLGLSKVVSICNGQVANRYGPHGKVQDAPDMMGSFIRHGLKKEELERESVVQLLAGSDTTATAIRATMMCLMTNPDAYKRLQEEIDAAVAAGQVPSDLDMIVPDRKARELSYLQAVIKEGLRWYPPITGLMSKVVPPEGDVVNGYFIPGGTDIAYNANFIHHNPLMFHPDPKAYRPERWLHTSVKWGEEPSFERLREMERNNELIFGSGRFVCLGKSIAMIELNKILVELLRRFNWHLIDPEHPWESKSFGIHIQRGLWCEVTKRQA